jgi:hypothetical protein
MGAVGPTSGRALEHRAVALRNNGWPVCPEERPCGLIETSRPGSCKRPLRPNDRLCKITISGLMAIEAFLGRLFARSKAVARP